MIQSMTAFARTQAQGKWGNGVCEVRSINHRYLELSIRLPEALHEFEPMIRERIRHYIKRGKIECFLRYQPGDAEDTEIIINTRLAEKICRANETIANLLKVSTPISTMEILQWPGVMQIAETNLVVVEQEIMQVLEKSLQDLVAARMREGEALKELFLQRLEDMKIEVAKARQRMPEVIKEQRERFMKRFADVKLELDSSRLEQEMVMYAQKTDVMEELDRIGAHISEVRHVLKHGGLVGRRLDFLMQELNREANTLGAKSVNVDISRVSVELKVLIEQVREQVQNIE